MAWISSLLARCPVWTMRNSRRCSVGSHRPVELCRGLVAFIDRLGQPPLVVGRQQVDPADLVEVHAHGVGGAARVDAAGVHALAAATTATGHQSIGILGRRCLRRAGSRRSACRRRRRRASRRCGCCEPQPPSAPPSSTSPVSSTVRSTWVISSASSTPEIAPRASRLFHSPGSTPGKGADSAGASDCPKLNHSPRCAVAATLATARLHRSPPTARRTAPARVGRLDWRGSRPHRSP